MLQTFILLLLISSASAGRSGGRVGGRSHTYPSSHGYSGTSSGGHTYPHSTGLSGTINSHKAQGTYSQQNNVHHSYKSEVHHHYHYNYNPPQQIHYGSGYHPVYHSQPPVYVYEYRDSGSRFDTLLTGLALYNLGRMSARQSHYESREYRSNPGEICKLGIKKQNGDYEETRIDCKLMSSFIWEAEKAQTQQNVISTKTVTTSVLNVTHISNGTRNDNNTNSNTVITTMSVQNKTVVDALQVKGPSIKVTQGMNCFMIRISRDSSILKKTVECGLLQTYAQNSLRYNGSGRLFPIMSMLLPLISMIVS